MINSRVYKIFSVLVAIAILGLGIFGCSKQSKRNISPKPNITDDGSFDLKGRTFRILNWEVKPGKGSEVYEDMGYEGSRMTERINNIESSYNCRIEYVGDGTTHPAWQKLHSSILVGEPNADIALTAYEYLVQSLEKGGLYTILNDYSDELELDNSDLWDQTAVKGLCTIDGLTAGVQPAMRGYELVNLGLVMFFNKSMLEREGLWNDYNLYDMQKNKTWMWETLDEIGTKVVKDKDGDGKTDQFGMVYSRYTVTGLNASNSEGGTQAGLYAVDEKNEPVLLVRQQPQINVMNFMSKSGLKGKGWMTAPNYGQQYLEGPRNFFATSQTAFLIDFGAAIQIFKEQEMKDTLGIVAVPIGPDCDIKDYVLGREGCAPWIIPSGVKNIKDTAMVMKELCAPLYSKEESDIATESALSEYIGEETGIIDTYKLLGEPEKMSYSMDSPFIATWWPSFASYQGNFFNLVETGMTGEELNKIWGDASQTDMNKYWKMVMEGVNQVKDNRAKEGK